MSHSSIQTTLVGSYPSPEWMLAFPGEQQVLDATRAVVNLQEKAGIDLVCDGELYRFDPNHPEANGMIEYFSHRLTGIRTDSTFEEREAYRAQKGTAYRIRVPGFVEETIGHGDLDLPSACNRIGRIATHPFKFTVTGPHMLAKLLVNRHYKSVEQMAFALADILAEQIKNLEADVVQIDEANLPGHPEEWEWAAEAINRMLDAVKGKPAVHLCFGNYAARSVQKGSWKNLIEYMNRLHADHLVLEMADRPREEIEFFKEVRPEIGLGIGVVDIKTTQVESPEQVAASIEHTASILGLERIRYIHPDCGLSKLKRFTADAKIEVLAKGRDLFEGR
ncbi:MAG: cobalamin-independent methionine synthase II family protein [Candidatus Omnitrophica bacterium]|nr:cobalamin-independent methionine synthase II family protein [Candidatus Omnitrophota bacterium]